MSHDAELADRIAAVRRFTRFYTRAIGVLQNRLLTTPYSLSEIRVLYELAQRDDTAARDLTRSLGLDAGYLSRILAKFDKRGLLSRRTSDDDARQSLLTLTPAGREVFAVMDEAQSADVSALIAHLDASGQRRLVAAMGAVEALLSSRRRETAYLLRGHEPGDLAWIAHRQAALYHGEYGWDATFEALVCEVCARFIREFDPGRERSWIAEIDGDIVGSVFCVRESDEIAKLRMLYVERAARGLGIGRRLVEECIRFARRRGYRRMTLWTNDVLVSAKRIYQAAGFELVAEETHRSFGKDLVGQTWELDLTTAAD